MNVKGWFYMIDVIKNILLLFIYGIIGCVLTLNDVTYKKLSFWVITSLSIALYVLGFIFGLLK